MNYSKLLKNVKDFGWGVMPSMKTWYEPGRVPTIETLAPGDLEYNVSDGLLYARGTQNDILNLGSQSGSNSDGKYTKTDDGYLVCTVRLTLVSSGTLWTYPCAFVDDPVVQATRVGVGVGAAWVCVVGAVTTDDCLANAFDLAGNQGDGQGIFMTAIGRWK